MNLMRLPDLLAKSGCTFSFEFFPPKDESGVEVLYERARTLAELKPSYVSVTYGAGGSTRQRTHEVVRKLKHEIGLNVAAHLTCVGHSRDELVNILQQYADDGIDNIVALRGDAPTGGAFTAAEGGLRYGVELVELIRQRFGDRFGIAVAGYPEGHPETVSRLDDMDYLKAKVDAGADCVVTQLFFDNRDFYDFRERCAIAGIDVPIIAGLMPVLSRKGILRMAGLCGSRLPAKLLRRLAKAGEDDTKVAKVGIDWAVQQSRDLLDNDVRGIHFYTLNRSSATIEIYRRLGAEDSQQLEDLSAL
jgi:methylenetetrahydrofolate reductase (NADPH)